MKSPGKDNKDVTAGGLLSLGISLSLLLAVDFLVPPESIGESFVLSLFVGLLVYVVASGVGSFLASYKMKEKYLINALKSSYFGFLINTVIMLFMQTFYGLAWILIGYTLGGVIGGSAAMVYNKRKKVG
jgi:hypothetical protein